MGLVVCLHEIEDEVGKKNLAPLRACLTSLFGTSVEGCVVRGLQFVGVTVFHRYGLWSFLCQA